MAVKRTGFTVPSFDREAEARPATHASGGKEARYSLTGRDQRQTAIGLIAREGDAGSRQPLLHL